MQDINHESRKSRGSSPPFQESERWLDDGANGAHWVKRLPEGAQPIEDRSIDSVDREPTALLRVDDEKRWEDDGGNGMRQAPISEQTLSWISRNLTA